MARLFFKDVPEGPTCSSCGRENTRMYYEDTELEFCDEACFVDWFLEQKADEYARKLAYENLREKD